MDNTYYLTNSYMAGNKLNENQTSLKKSKKLIKFYNKSKEDQI